MRCHSSGSQFTGLTEPLYYFSVGVFANALARGADYFAGNAGNGYTTDAEDRRFFYGLTITLATLRLLTFPLGCWRTAASLFSLGSAR